MFKQPSLKTQTQAQRVLLAILYGCELHPNNIISRREIEELLRESGINMPFITFNESKKLLVEKFKLIIDISRQKQGVEHYYVPNYENVFSLFFEVKDKELFMSLEQLLKRKEIRESYFYPKAYIKETDPFFSCIEFILQTHSQIEGFVADVKNTPNEVIKQYGSNKGSMNINPFDLSWLLFPSRRLVFNRLEESFRSLDSTEKKELRTLLSRLEKNYRKYWQKEAVSTIKKSFRP